jgi:activator of Hsp90 ATPase-like protein
VAKELRGSVLLPVPIGRAWDLWVDAWRFPQWQSLLLAVRDLSGPVSEVGTTYTLDHGPKMRRHARVVAAERPVRHVIEQTGMGVRDQTVATFEPEGSGTRLTVVTYAHLGFVMRALTRLYSGQRDQREFQREIDRLVGLAQRTPPPARAGGVYLANAGAMRRRLVVLAVDPERIHVRLKPGHLGDRDRESLVPPPPKPPSEQMDLSPISPPLRASTDAQASGLTFLRRDGGHGVAHLALSLDAWADAAPREIGEESLTDDDTAAVETWRLRGSPTVGMDADLELAPICTVRLGIGPDENEVWGIAKVLRSEITKVHLAIAPERWTVRPEQVRSWTAFGGPPVHAVPLSDLGDIAFRAIGHVPVTRSAFSAAKPRFVGIATVEHDELDGYRHWRAVNAGAFETLQFVLDLRSERLTAELTAALDSLRPFLLSDDVERGAAIDRSDRATLDEIVRTIHPLFGEINEVLDRMAQKPHPLPADQEQLESDLNSLGQLGVEAQQELERRPAPD